MSALHVFGYGSLIWYPGFQYSHSVVGKINGFKRGFWQGSNTHRGNSEQMGRVVTLIEEEGVSTWGRAFQFTDETSTLAYLQNREQSLGGYTTVITQFYPRDPKEESFPVLVYIALPCNPLFLGTAPLAQMASDIALSKGECGYNVEYLAKLAAFMRIQLPNILDEHLYNLEELVRKKLSQINPQLLKLFDDAIMHELIDSNALNSMMHLSDEKPNQTITNTYESRSYDNNCSEMSSKYTDRVTTRKLRCINK